MSTPRPNSDLNQAPKRERATRGAAGVVLLLFLGLAVYLLLPQVATIEHSWDVLKSLSLWAVSLAVVAQCLVYLWHGYVVQDLLALFRQRLSLIRCIAIVIASYSLAVVWGGQFTNTGAAFRWLRAGGASVEGSVMGSIAPALLNLISIYAFSMLGLAFFVAVGDVPKELTILLIAALALFLGCGLLLWGAMKQKRWLTAVLQRASSGWARLRHRPSDPESVRRTSEGIFSAWDKLMAGRWQRPAAGDALSVACDFLTLYLLFIAAGYTANPGLVLAGYGLPLLAGKLSFLPGGVGIIEGGMAASYEALGVPSQVFVVVILSYRLISFWIPVLLGFPFALWLDRQRPIAKP